MKELSWNVGGHVLHSIFGETWPRRAKAAAGLGEAGGPRRYGVREFGNFERFKREFSQAAMTVEGSGWATLTLCKMTGRLLIMQIEKHNVNVVPRCPILMVLDVFERAYYIDYKTGERTTWRPSGT